MMSFLNVAFDVCSLGVRIRRLFDWIFLSCLTALMPFIAGCCQMLSLTLELHCCWLQNNQIRWRVLFVYFSPACVAFRNMYRSVWWVCTSCISLKSARARLSVPCCITDGHQIYIAHNARDVVGIREESLLWLARGCHRTLTWFCIEALL
jgi:hypothetical protein